MALLTSIIAIVLAVIAAIIVFKIFKNIIWTAVLFVLLLAVLYFLNLFSF